MGMPVNGNVDFGVRRDLVEIALWLIRIESMAVVASRQVVGETDRQTVLFKDFM